MPYIPQKTGRDALEELDRVAWGDLTHAYSGGAHRFGAASTPGEDVPEILRSLFGNDEDTRSMAHVDGIMAFVWHQGTVYPVTPQVVPFLAAFAADRAAPVRGYLLAALVAIVCSALSAEDDALLAPEILDALRQCHSHLERVAGTDEEVLAEAASWLLSPSLLDPEEREGMYAELEQLGDDENAED